MKALSRWGYFWSYGNYFLILSAAFCCVVYGLFYYGHLALNELILVRLKEEQLLVDDSIVSYMVQLQDWLLTAILAFLACHLALMVLVSYKFGRQFSQRGVEAGKLAAPQPR